MNISEINAGFTINPNVSDDIGTGSNGREIFTGSISHPVQGRGRNAEWAYRMGFRYTDNNPSIITHQIDLVPRDKWRVSYAQEWEHDAGNSRVLLHRLKVNRDLRAWTLSFDLEWDREDDSQSASVNLTPHSFGKF